MSHVLNAIRVAAIAIAVCAASCGSKKEGTPPPENLPVHTLVFGGDVFLGDGISRSLFDEANWPGIFGDVQDIMQAADVTVVNGEGVISGGGLFAYKEDYAPLCYRAHPNAAPALARAGVDIVNVGNNHAGDYGTDAFTEMLDRLMSEGIDYTGGGHTLEDARTPTVRLVGDTGIAVVGADLTSTAAFAAKRNMPGTLFFSRAADGKNMDTALTVLGNTLAKAREAADVVLFTPHWGHNWQKAPTKHLRALAKRLIRMGYDGILGHSAHLFQGVELIDGKPVIYDAGNLLLNYGPQPGDHGEHRAVLYELQFTRAGITGVTAHPLALERNRVRLARGPVSEEILKTLKARSKALGTELIIDEGTGFVACAPGNMSGPKTAAAEKKPFSGSVREAPTHMHVDRLPKNAVPLTVQFENGLSLLGYRILSNRLPRKRPAQVIETYWSRSVDTTANDGILIHMDAETETKNGPKKAFSGHIPGDWVLPVSQWPQGGIVRDITYFRLTLPVGNPVKFYTGLWDGRTLVPVSKIGDPTRNSDGRIYLDTATFSDDAPGVFDLFETLRQDLAR